MKKVRKFLTGLLLIVVIATVTLSCSPERRLAKAFTEAGTTRNALLLATDVVYKTNLKTDILDTLGITDKSLFDSVLLANSEVVGKIDDEKFMQNYLLGFERELRRFNFNVYLESQTGDFLNVDSNAYVIYIAQVELEESYFPFRDEAVYNESLYYHEHKLNSVSVYSWFEISEVNRKNKRQVYFAEDAVVDEVDGEFTYDQFGGDIKYFYTIDSLKPADLYEYAYTLGRKYAGYTYDLLMNKYISENMTEPPQYYLRYDPNTKTFFDATDDKFIPLEK